MAELELELEQAPPLWIF
ncbi:Uncharacterized protein APZ42_022097 [Daphnia magna]|uniref:Uncharacterized protein n=1 Tax=Daphnia magna TaxID=35525 RepID=A0A164W1A7_9CRUS|nr:Uncharacterized protein APZ42_022097 [Daphnia magna]